MDSLHQDPAAPSADDLSALAWVQEELRRSLDATHKALQRCLKDLTATQVSDLDALDPSVLRTARQQLHQSAGALELAGLTAGATLLRASESLVQKWVSRPQSMDAAAVHDIERASFALMDYIGRKLAGKAVTAVALFPQYEALVSRVGGGLPRPSDLWSQDWPSLSLESRLEAPDDVEPRKPDAGTVDAFERGLLGLFAISFVWLGKIGAGPGTDPVETIVGRFLTGFYFLFFLTMPIWTKIDKTKPVPERVTTHD